MGDGRGVGGPIGVEETWPSGQGAPFRRSEIGGRRCSIWKCRESFGLDSQLFMLPVFGDKMGEQLEEALETSLAATT